MATATRTTGRAQRAPGKSLAQNRAASQILPGRKRIASARRPIPLDVTMLQALLIDNAHRKYFQINRQPRRLEITVSRTKQTSETQINRQQIATSRITHPCISNRRNQHAALWTTDRVPWLTDHYSPITTHCLSNRHTPRLENAISHRKQTRGTLSSRHFLQVPASHQRRVAVPDRPPQVASRIVSNRQSQILEFAKNSTKTPFSSVLIDTKTRFLRPRQGLGAWVRGSQNTDHGFTGHQSLLTNHASLLPVIYSSHTPNPGSSYK